MPGAVERLSLPDSCCEMMVLFGRCEAEFTSAEEGAGG